MEIEITGKPLTLEIRMLGALLRRLHQPLAFTEQELAEVSGVELQGLTLFASYHQTKPEKIETQQIAEGSFDLSGLEVGGRPCEIVWQTRNAIWFIPAPTSAPAEIADRP